MLSKALSFWWSISPTKTAIVAIDPLRHEVIIYTNDGQYLNSKVTSINLNSD